mmetsp:Transcript_11212/g.12612  ORF Transcript_11212/g.12612 Transcript_11212/m.12612 type:complete len:148 (+) Transcript_11212:179-622(+)
MMRMIMMMTQCNNNSKAEEEEDNDGNVDDEDKEAKAAGERKGGLNDIDDDDDEDNDDDDKIVYPIRYCTHAVPMERQQLQQQKSIEMRMKKSQWYYHSFPPDNIYISLHPTYNTESDIIITNSRHEQSIHYHVIRVPSHHYQHDTII